MAGTATAFQLPEPHYEPIYFPDGTHSGVRFDRLRGILEIQKKGVKQWFDLTTMRPVTPNAKGM